MKVLWFTNIPMPDVNNYFQKDAMGTGGWMGSLLSLLKNTPNLELGVVTACSQFPETHFKINDVDYFIIKQQSTRFRRSLFPVDNDPSYLNKCVAIINTYKPDIVHIHGTERFYAKILHSQLIHCPVVISIQGIMCACSNWYRWFGKLTLFDILKITWRDSLKFSGLLWDLRVAKQQGKREKLFFRTGRYFFGRTDWDKANVFYYNSHAKYFKISEVLRPVFWENQWKLENCKRHRIIFTNARHPRKGIEILFKACKRLKSIYPDIELVLVGTLGSGGYSRYIKQKIDALEGIVLSCGQLHAREIVHELCNAHIFISASYIDNSPNSVAEAQLVGMPVISSYTGGVPSMVKDGLTGLLFPTDDVPLLVDRIRTIFENDTLAKQLGANAKKSAQKRHNPWKIIQTHLTAYKDIIKDAKC